MLKTFIPSFDDVRAVLGVSDEELSDETLSLNLYKVALTEAYEDVSSTLLDLVVELQTKEALVKEDPTATNMTRPEKRLLGLSSVYATYVVAVEAASSMPMFAAQTISDGKAEGSRFAGAYQSTLQDAKAQLEDYRNRLQNLLTESFNGQAVTATIYTPFSRATLSIDPVTNENM